MPRQVIILETKLDSEGKQHVDYLFWFAVAANKQVPIPGFVSACRNCTAAELASLQSGTVVERQGFLKFQSTHASLLTFAQTDLQARWVIENAAFQAQPSPNLMNCASWDGTTWTAPPVTPPPMMVGKYQHFNLRPAAIGDATVVPATAGQSIAIYRMKLIATGTVAVTIKNGAVNYSGAFNMTNTVQVSFDLDGEPHFITSPGNAFIVNLSAAIGVVITGCYTKG